MKNIEWPAILITLIVTVLFGIIVLSCSTTEYTKAPDGTVTIKYSRLWTTHDGLEAEMTRVGKDEVLKVKSTGQKVQITPEQASAMLRLLLPIAP